MKTRFSVILALVAVTSAPLARSAGDDEKLQKRVDEIRKQLEELRKKEKDLLEQERDLLKARIEREREKQRNEAERIEREERERLQKEIAEKKKHYAKVEIRGKLGKATHGNPNHQTVSWHASINELSWTLQFDEKNSELLALAEKHAGKGVVITGRVLTTKVYRSYGPYPGIANPYPPIQWPQPPNPFPRTPQVFPEAPMNLFGEAPPTILVESIKLATD